MGTNTGHVMTLANSIIGVSVLAMPFCFKQCGIVLAILMLIVSSIMTRLACHYLIKSATLARRRTFEFLAFHTFGPTGKLTVELSIIGFMLGTCVAFFVVVGDLGPAILGPILGVDNPSSIRTLVLTGIALFVVLPLGLLRNVDSLAAISAATIAFYICLVLKVMGEATTHMLAWDWMDKVYLWRPSGVLQCIPIFAMALSCQTQLFEIFDSIQNGTLEKMNAIVCTAINLCTLMYVAMGFFGYVAFCTQPFSGNLMLSFSSTPTSEVIKMGFVLSVAVSFPLVIFPCRASLHSLLFRRGVPPHYELLNASNHIPETRFKCITIGIVAVSLVTGLMIPNIELVLGLVGSTIGVLICVIIPASLFLCLTTKNNNERLLAQVLFVMGVLIMVLGSYANLYATEQAIAKGESAELKVATTSVSLSLDSKDKIKENSLKEIKNVDHLAAGLPELMKDVKEVPATQTAVVAKVEDKSNMRKEPPFPEAPVVKTASEPPEHQEPQKKAKEEPLQEKKVEPLKLKEELSEKKEEAIHNDAIKKEDDEIKEVEKQEILKKKENLIEKLEENEEKQKKLLEEQKKILQDIKLEKEKLDIEKSDMKVGGQLLKIRDGGLNVENEIGEKDSLVNSKNDDKINLRLPENVINDPKLDNKVNSEVKEVEKVVRDDMIKKNMADGVPLPLAVQNIIPQIEVVKSLKIVNNPENPNEGNADSKVLRREILEDEGEKEQREKRDVQEVFEVDLKINNSKRKSEDVEIVKLDDSFDMPNSSVKKTESKIVLVNTNVLLNNKTAVMPIETNKSNRQEKDLSIEEENMKQCEDKTKLDNYKFSDELKPSEVVDNKKVILSENPDNILTDVKPLIEATKPEQTAETIIKAPSYLSNPQIVLPDDKIPPGVLDGNDMKNEVKPMKRDLKSVDMTGKRDAKESET